MKKLLFILAIIGTTVSIQAQTHISSSPFKALPKPGGDKTFGVATGTMASTVVTAWRFVDAAPGFDVITRQVVTGAGYGYQWLRWDDASQKYKSFLSINGMLYATGYISPTSDISNIAAVGAGIGLLNNLILVTPVYNLPLNGAKGRVGLNLTLGISFNN